MKGCWDGDGVGVLGSSSRIRSGIATAGEIGGAVLVLGEPFKIDNWPSELDGEPAAGRKNS